MHGVEAFLVSEEESTERAERRIGQLVRDRWRLDAVLGVGGMASVYAATHRNGKRVALKMLHAELSASPEMRQRFIDEGYAANRVEHPGAVSVIDDDVSEDGAVFLVMDLLEGETLEERSADRGLTVDDVLVVADAVLDILAAAHDKGIIHRDVKPANIFITRDGNIKLLDFGIAHVMGTGPAHPTLTGAVMGTPAFMPPEQAGGRWEEFDGRTDLWAVGATMFVELCGSPVHEAKTISDELRIAMTQVAPSLGSFARALPKPLVELVDRALAFERANRWPSAREMQAEVRRVAAVLASDRSLTSIAPSTVSILPGIAVPVIPGFLASTSHVLEERPLDNHLMPVIPGFLAPTSRVFEERPAARRPKVLFSLAGVASVLALVAIAQLGKSHGSARASPGSGPSVAIAKPTSFNDVHATSTPASRTSALADPSASAAPTSAPPREWPMPSGIKAARDRIQLGQPVPGTSVDEKASGKKP
jgi:serine/threonine-protein kinase